MNICNRNDKRMAELKRTTQQILQAVRIADGDTPFDRLLIPVLLIVGAAYTALQVTQRDTVEAVFFGGSVLLLVLLLIPSIGRRVLGRAFNRRHATHTILFWVYGVIWINLIRLLPNAESFGKNSTYFYTLMVALIAITLMMLRSLAILTRRGYAVFSTRIPVWEQLLIANNEAIAAALLAAFGGTYLARIAQPNLFTAQLNIPYIVGFGSAVVGFYILTQVMWIQRFNDMLSRKDIWLRLARLISPFVLIVISLVIVRRLTFRADPRTAGLLGSETVDLAVLALAPVIWLVVAVGMLLVYSGRRGIRERFLPDSLLDRLPARISAALRSISDMDMLLIVSLMATLVPAYFLILGDSGGVIGVLRDQLLSRASALIETSEQALAFLSALPFFVVNLILLSFYGYVLSRPMLSAKQRDDMVERLPIGFVIILNITFYLFVIFTQVFTEGRLPQIPQDLGRILAYNILIPLALLYAQYLFFIRFPYGRGQQQWREREAERLNIQLLAVDRQLDEINRQLRLIDRNWQDARAGERDFDMMRNFDTLYRYMQASGIREEINMQRLEVLSERQQLNEVSEAPVSLAVARLPIRVVSLGIPLLLAIQIYQWAVVNNGLRQIIETPNLTVFDFFRAILEQFQF
jgi:hypothetical protein